ncbi:MerR family transcriptional regulator [Kitasatospora sp. NPDC059795]|uniref:MerR family transcriptional regulator n=1 Tax=unclassified Kitasatospora TaxID=2633591 RepID=UPI00093A33C8|nr:MerR family transcriptional regulator [Kitasatospora sp. CB01950]OKJ16813.1 MerR family transcriptional regulator [Kitasatospora sp. CB01950]
MTTQQLLTPAEAAERSGFSLDTLRYYERIGLLTSITRATSGHRRFTPDDLAWLGILRCLRDTGMPIADMRRYAELARTDHPDSLRDRIALLEKHDTAVNDQITLLARQRTHLRDKIDYYRTVLDAD